MKQRPSAWYAATAGSAVFIVAILSVPICAFLWDPSDPVLAGHSPIEKIGLFAIWNGSLGIPAGIATAAIVGLWVESYRAIRALFSSHRHNGPI